MSDDDWDNDTPMKSAQKSNNAYEKTRGNSGYQDSYEFERSRNSGFNDDRRNDYNDRNSRDFNENLTVRSDQIGRVIGRAGANIKRIQSSYSVYVKIDKSSNEVVVSGKSSTQVHDAIAEIKKQLNDGNEGGGRGPSNDNRWQGRNDNRYEGKNERSSGRDNYSRDNYRREERKYGEGGGGGGGSKNWSNNYQFEDKLEGNDLVNSEGIIDWEKLNKQADEARKIRWAQCPPLTKDFYKEAPEVANMTAEKAEQLRNEQNHITVSRVFENTDAPNNDIPNPIWKFEQCFADYPDLLDEIRQQNFETPSPIQSQAWPVLLKGEDLIGIAQTGTGKTLAFLLPAMIHTDGQSVPRSERGGPNVLIMAPTRELALQIEKEVNKYSFRNMKAVCVYGGGDRREQIVNVEKGVEIIICTPGRLNDLIQAKVINISSVTYLVLDEADRMLDMGFEPQIRKVLLDIRPDRQTVMTSATWPPGVRRLAQSYMSNPIQVCVGSLDLAATQTVKQIIEIIEEGDKSYMIRQFIKNMKPDDKVIIFMGKKTRADDLSSDLTLEGHMCTAIHGSREQSDREQAIADITSGEIRILIATDVASRGLDIEDITYVLNYDFPRNIEEYVHRVGRTGRAGRLGTSISYFTRSDWSVARELIDILEKGDQEVPEELRQMAQRFTDAKARQAAEGRTSGGRGYGGGGGGGRGGGYRNQRF